MAHFGLTPHMVIEKSRRPRLNLLEFRSGTRSKRMVLNFLFLLDSAFDRHPKNRPIKRTVFVSTTGSCLL